MALYLTLAPRMGLTDERRNCISNVRPAGLGFDAAGAKLHHLLIGAHRRQVTGVGLKDETDSAEKLVGSGGRSFFLWPERLQSKRGELDPRGHACPPYMTLATGP